MPRRKHSDEETVEERLAGEIAKFFDDPAGYVRFVFPWGEDGPLENEEGADVWQEEVLERMGECIRDNDWEGAIQIAVSSGHGIGKTCLIAWIIHWFIATRPTPQIVVTSNTKEQLLHKTWRELAKWNKMAINGHWFEWTQTKFTMRSDPENWYATAVSWSKERSEAFAGTHEKHVLMLFDEGSAIDDSIWEVAEGAMTTKGAIWVVFGNPTRNTGRFRECFHKFRHRWWRKQIDSRTAKMADKKKIQQWIDDYGEDSDFVRVRVRGVFPRASSMQFISTELAEGAQGKVIPLDQYMHASKILGVDVARFGDDQSVIFRRQGLVATLVDAYREVDTMTLAGRVAQEIEIWKPDAVFIDIGAMGAGVIDRLRQLNYDVVEVAFGSEATKSKEYYNKRSEMWAGLRDWLKAGGCTPVDQELVDDLVGPEYGFDFKDRIQLERKEHMKDRGLASPDKGDALALTFAYPVIKKSDRGQMATGQGVEDTKNDFDPTYMAKKIALARKRARRR